MKQHIVISAVGGDRVGMVHELSKAIADCGGSISESRMTSLGNEFAMLLLVNGNWHTLAKLEGEFKKLADATGMNIQLRRTEERAARNDMLPYSIDVVCLDQTGIVAGLSGFFAQRSVDNPNIFLLYEQWSSHEAFFDDVRHKHYLVAYREATLKHHAVPRTTRFWRAV